MTEKKGRGQRRSDRLQADAAAELKAKRTEFVQSFFKKGAELTDSIVRENERHRARVAELEEENLALKSQLKKDHAIRDLLGKIQQLERENERLSSHWHEAEAETGRFSNRFREVESELENVANLYVASYQLHASLKIGVVARNVKEVLIQLVGARSFAVFLRDDAKNELSPVVTHGLPDGGVAPVRLGKSHDDRADATVAETIEEVFLTGLPIVREGLLVTASKKAAQAKEAGELAACIPLKVDEKGVGIIAVYALLDQKKHFVSIDHELFKLLGAHAGGALISAELYARAAGKIPRLDSLGAEKGDGSGQDTGP